MEKADIIIKVKISAKWIFVLTLLGVLSGSASAIFLLLLDWVTSIRIQQNLWIYALPIAGLVIGFAYSKWGKTFDDGNQLIASEYKNPKQILPLLMAPFVMLSTLLTHIVGGSAGREGTSIQMGAALADRLILFLKISESNRKLLIISGVASGFASIFGTPLAGAIFALEILKERKPVLLFPLLYCSFLADFICHAWQVQHSQYNISFYPEFSFKIALWCLVAGTCFGIAARLFIFFKNGFSNVFKRIIPQVPVRTFVGGIILLILFSISNTERFMGLGIDEIQSAFSERKAWIDFGLKILFTAFTLGVGFKGGEATPMFFTGAMLGNSLSSLIPIPMGLLAGMGFAAVYAGVTLAPIACTIMAGELFGWQCVPFVLLASYAAKLVVGKRGVYSIDINQENEK